MRKSKKTIIYMLVALVVAVSAVLVDFGYSYAQSSFSDVPDADWHYWEKKKGVWTSTTGIEGFPDGCPENYPDISSCGAKYLEQFKYRQYLDSFLPYSEMDCSVSADSEIVCYINSGLTQEDLDFEGYGSSNLGLFDAGIVCKDKIYFRGWGWAYGESYDNTWKSSGVWGEQNKYIDFANPQTVSQKGDYFAKLALPAGGTILGFMAGKMKVFNSFREAVSYLNTGDTSGLAWQGGTPKQTYNSELAFTSFDMSVHDSNSFDDYYLEFIYKCPDSWLGKDPKLVINQTWDYNIYYFNNKGTSQPYSVDGSNTCTLTVSGNNNSVKIPLGQLDCLKKVVSDNFLGQSSAMKRQILGASFSMNNGHYFTFNGLPIMADGSCKVDKSLLSLSCVVYVDGVAGHEYVGSVDLISGDNSMSTYTPDTSGNYTYNDDYRKNGHYYTDVSKDAAGNTTYNYYYYGMDGSKKDVSANDAANNTVSNTIQEGAIQNNNNPTFTNNNNITVEGDTINNDVNNYVGNNTSSETNKNFIEKFLGFFQFLENNSFLGVWGKVFGWLPPGISSVITTALGIGACVGLFKFFRK